MGADFIEPDLVSTKDGVLHTHANVTEIGPLQPTSTERFPDRKTARSSDGKPPHRPGSQKTLALSEIKTLRARERLAFRSPRVRRGSSSNSDIRRK
jgi:glycerophosphoryl diester phosphodiesterase